MKIPDGVVVHIGSERFEGQVPDDKARSVGLSFSNNAPPGGQKEKQ